MKGSLQSYVDTFMELGEEDSLSVPEEVKASLEESDPGLVGAAMISVIQQGLEYEGSADYVSVEEGPPFSLYVSDRHGDLEVPISVLGEVDQDPALHSNITQVLLEDGKVEHGQYTIIPTEDGWDAVNRLENYENSDSFNGISRAESEVLSESLWPNQDLSKYWLYEVDNAGSAIEFYRQNPEVVDRLAIAPGEHDEQDWKVQVGTSLAKDHADAHHDLTDSELLEVQGFEMTVSADSDPDTISKLASIVDDNLE